MHLGREMQRLRAEHAALATLADFLMQMVSRPQPPRPTELAAVRGMLRDTLTRHLKCEDWALYPRLKAAGDARLTEVATEFVDEMGHMAAHFADYDARWTAEEVAADWDGFSAETTGILHAIAMRIEREEADLYPAADLLVTAGHAVRQRPPARVGAARIATG